MISEASLQVEKKKQNTCQNKIGGEKLALICLSCSRILKKRVSEFCSLILYSFKLSEVSPHLKIEPSDGKNWFLLQPALSAPGRDVKKNQ